MVVRRSNSRRRRVVIDPAVGSAATKIHSSLTNNSQRTASEDIDPKPYSAGAKRKSQRKTTDLIPKRLQTYLLLILALMVCLFCLSYGSQNHHKWAQWIGQSGQRMFTLGVQGSLASWFSSFLLIISGMASLQICALRQHRCDDYRGTYRVWGWLAGLFLFASIACVVDVMSVIGNLSKLVFNPSTTSIVWLPVAIKICALSLIVVRGLIEVRESRGAFAVVAFVWFAYTTAALMQIPTGADQMVGISKEAVMGNCFLFGTAGVFLANVTYLRHVYLLAHGLIKVQRSQATVEKKAKSKKKVVRKTKATRRKNTAKKTRTTKTSNTKKAVKKTEAPAEKSQALVAATPDQPVEQKPPRRTAAKEKFVLEKTPAEKLAELAAASRERELEQDEEEGVVKMTKSQRRKLRKQQKQNRRRAA